jgi:hypothetical protein
MMGEQTGAQEALFFGFCIEGHVLLIRADEGNFNQGIKAARERRLSSVGEFQAAFHAVKPFGH